ncbi:DNA alkylation repair protein [Methanocella sp. MCL-LM]|uniref:DNA alkylation repair protein n=1 Tax=Methanocella sp. MCL-LM TaxID=3412035 RepID=UPI003C7099CC
MSTGSKATPDISTIIDRFKALDSPKDRDGMARFGIRTDRAFGISLYVLRDMAKEIGTSHELSLALWDTGYHEARILAGIVDDPKQVTSEQMDAWVAEFDSWDVCDQCCSNLFDQTPFAYDKAFQWADDEREFVRRSGFVMMAALAVHDKKAGDDQFEQFFPVMKKYATDDRNFVRKAVNWALRNIGKRNLALNARAIEVTEEIRAINTKSARWIASDALRELRSEKVQARLAAKAKKAKC